MIKEEYVSFETAKLLKEAGFPQCAPVPNYYEDDGYTCISPSQSLAMRWLREAHHITVEPLVALDEQWCINVWDFKTADTIADDEVDRFPTYEAAAEAGIQAACKYIIGIEPS